MPETTKGRVYIYVCVCTGKEIKIIELERASLWNFEPLKQMQRAHRKGMMGCGALLSTKKNENERESMMPSMITFIEF
jgi:hypothetical protein